MEIALVTETFPPDVNGVAMTLYRLSRGAVERGHAYTVYRPRPHLPLPEPGVGDPQMVTLGGLPIPGYPELRFGLPTAGKFLRPWRKARPDAIHIATEGPLGFAALRAARRLGLPLVTSFHTNFHIYTEHYSGYGPFKRWVLSYMRWLHNQGQRTFVPSQTVRANLAEFGIERLEVLGRGVDTRLYSPARRDAALRQSWGAESEEIPVALYVGRIAPEKNLGLVIRAWKEMRSVDPRTRLVLVGDGPDRARLERENPDAVFAGMRRGEELAAHYASADLFLFASVTETFGNVVTEAMASGLVVLAYDYAAAHALIRDGVEGRTTPLYDEAGFLAAASEIAAAPKCWPGIRTAARKKAMELGWDAIIDQYLTHLREVVAVDPEAMAVTE